MSEEEKLEFIKKEIERSGFPFEISVASLLKKRGWEVLPSPLYLDEDEEKWREIDIVAHKTFRETKDRRGIAPYALSVSLVIECKTSEAYAWVFFPLDRDPADFKAPRAKYQDFLTVVKRQSLTMAQMEHNTPPSRGQLQMLDLSPNLFTSHRGLVTPEVAQKLKFLSELGVIGTGAFTILADGRKAINYKEIKVGKSERRGNQEGSPEIFEGTNQLIKGTKHALKLASEFVYAAAEWAKQGHELGRYEIAIFLPILVFGGDIYTWVNGQVEGTDHVLVEGKCLSNRYFDSMLINVIKHSYLNTCLSLIDEDAMELVEKIGEKHVQLDEQVEAIKKSQPYDGRSWTYGAV